MQSDHMSSQYWICFACAEPAKFSDEEGFSTHLQLEHDDTISADQIPFFVSDCMCTTPISLSSCPLCMQVTGDEVEPDALLRHVAEHVHSFALTSLPWPVPGKLESEFLGIETSKIQNITYFALSSGPASLTHTRSSIANESMNWTESAKSGLIFQDEQPGCRSLPIIDIPRLLY